MKIQDFIMNGRDFHDDRSRFNNEYLSLITGQDFIMNG